MKLEFSRQIFEKLSNIKFHEDPSNGSRVTPWGQSDGWRDMTKLFAILRTRLKIFQTKVVEKLEIRISCSITFFFPPENRAVCEIKWQNAVEQGRPQMAVWRMRIASCIPKATNVHTGCVILLLSIVTMVARTRLNVTLHVNWMSFCF
jgi:hypothetical protein